MSRLGGAGTVDKMMGFILMLPQIQTRMYRCLVLVFLSLRQQLKQNFTSMYSFNPPSELEAIYGATMYVYLINKRAWLH